MGCILMGFSHNTKEDFLVTTQGNLGHTRGFLMNDQDCSQGSMISPINRLLFNTILHHLLHREISFHTSIFSAATHPSSRIPFSSARFLKTSRRRKGVYTITNQPSISSTIITTLVLTAWIACFQGFKSSWLQVPHAFHMVYFDLAFKYYYASLLLD